MASSRPASRLVTTESSQRSGYFNQTRDESSVVLDYAHEASEGLLVVQDFQREDLSLLLFVNADTSVQYLSSKGATCALLSNMNRVAQY